MNRENEQKKGLKEEKKERKIKPGIALEKGLISEIDEMIPRANVESRNEFIEKAVRFYIGYLVSRNAGDYVYPVMFDLIHGAIAQSEHKMTNSIVTILKKHTVETAALMHLIADEIDMSGEEYKLLLELCEEEVEQLYSKKTEGADV